MFRLHKRGGYFRHVGLTSCFLNRGLFLWCAASLTDTVCPAEIPSAVAVALSAIGSGSVIVINPHLGGRPTHEYITRSNKRDLQIYSTLQMNTNKATEGLLNVVEHKDDIQSFAACFYVKEAKTNNACLCKIATSANANKPIRQLLL